MERFQPLLDLQFPYPNVGPGEDNRPIGLDHAEDHLLHAGLHLEERPLGVQPGDDDRRQVGLRAGPLQQGLREAQFERGGRFGIEQARRRSAERVRVDPKPGRAAGNVGLRETEVHVVVFAAHAADPHVVGIGRPQERHRRLGPAELVLHLDLGIEPSARLIDGSIGDRRIVDCLPARRSCVAGQDADCLGVAERRPDRLVEREAALGRIAPRIGNGRGGRHVRESCVGKLRRIADLHPALLGKDQPPGLLGAQSPRGTEKCRQQQRDQPQAVIFAHLPLPGVKSVVPCTTRQIGTIARVPHKIRVGPAWLPGAVKISQLLYCRFFGRSERSGSRSPNAAMLFAWAVTSPSSMAIAK
jgi:hypothetical protein